jgi:teichuronic acid biosynthesis glycosyltransferase TuaC
MRILVVTNIYPTENRPFMSTFVKEQVESLRKYYPDLIIDVRIIKGQRPRWEYIKEMLLLPAVVKRGKFDIVHAHFGLTLVSLLFVRTPVVVTFHGSDLLVNPTKHVSRLLAPMASKVIVVAKKLQESLGDGKVIPCGIDVRKFALPLCCKNKPGPKMTREIKILFPSDPARIIKGYGLFQSVCEEMKKKGYKVEEIHLVNIKRANVHKIYWKCDIMLLTSISEGSPMVIKEAIAAKLPFVSVDVGDVKEFVKLINFGIIVHGRDSKMIAKAVIKLITKIKFRALINNEKCLETIDQVNTAKRIKRVYDQVIERRL